MTAGERSSIANAIWLCSNCHKVIDKDENRFPAGLLFEWQAEHANYISSVIGKAGYEVRRRYEDRHSRELGDLSYLSERIVREKDQYWEYKLTAEVIRYESDYVFRRWRALKSGLYVKNVKRVDKLECNSWIRDRIAEASSISHAFSGTLNNEFARAWDLPGVPGNDKDIVFACRLVAEICKTCLDWEERVRFTVLHEYYQDVGRLYHGIVGALIDESMKVPDFLVDTLSTQTSGNHKLTLELTLPEGWSTAVESALDRATSAVIGDFR